MRSARIVAYLIIFYVIAFLIWWSVLLLKTEQRSYVAQQALIEQQIQSGTLPEGTNLKEADSLYSRNRRMIIMEGFVFLVLLLGASFFVLRTIRKQERFVELKRNFLLGTTHELRSPIAALKLSLQTLQNKTIDQDSQALLMDNSISEVNRLNNLIDNILLATKIDSREYSFQLEAVQLSELVERTVREFNTRGREVTTHITPDIHVQGDQSALTIVLNNLLDNAIKYSSDNGAVIVSLQEKHGSAVLSVSDQGIGIPDHEKPNIWKRFYRIGNEEVRNSKGTGLGLFLVKSMTKLNGGKVAVKDNHPKGSIFTIIIPQTKH